MLSPRDRDSAGISALHFNLGNALAAAGDKAGAIAAYRRATELQPIFAEAHYNLGTILKDFGEVRRGGRLFRTHAGAAA